MKKLLLKSLFEKVTGDFRVVYWDGEDVTYGNVPPKIKIIFKKAPPLNFDFADPMLFFGEAYVDEVFDFEGDLGEVIQIVELNKNIFTAHGQGSKLALAFNTINSATNRWQQKENIKHHYDLGNDFFSLWLDETMSYSCAYFNTIEDSLFQAQMQKIHHILRKLSLKPGERLLDIGSGWGWLILTAAQMYGVNALGLTLSEEQFSATRERISKMGLADKVDVMLINYQDLDETKYQFDKIVSVGMFEHVGKENLPKYMKKINRLLTPGGVSLLHTITATKEKPVNSWMEKYIFPGGYVPSLRETMWLLPEYDFHLLHVESLRMHYAATLDRWYVNFGKHIDEIEQKFGKRFVRMWSIYLRGCAASFRTSGLNIHQLLFSKGLNNSLPLTFNHLYTDRLETLS
ncbi:MAG: cfa [Anaerosporomusa subterranea]|jgi:cyclopropane-fatty-acyl-phospholipid synthase|nr:cfa [Anaerosporomusa subterranea]